MFPVGSINRLLTTSACGSDNPEKMASYNLTPGCDQCTERSKCTGGSWFGWRSAAPKSQTFELGILVNGRLNKVSDFEYIMQESLATENWFT